MQIAAFILLDITGLVMVFLTSIGTLIILAASVLYGFMTGFRVLGLNELMILVLLYAAGELFEYLVVVIGARSTGSSRWAAFGALAGGLAGGAAGMFFGGIGLFPGTLAGIFLGAFSVEIMSKKGIKRSLRAGVGGVMGRFSAIIIKFLNGTGMSVFALMKIISGRP